MNQSSSDHSATKNINSYFPYNKRVPQLSNQDELMLQLQEKEAIKVTNHSSDTYMNAIQQQLYNNILMERSQNSDRRQDGGDVYKNIDLSRMTE
jgi:hypothetical protein